MARDNFNKAVIKELAREVGNYCSICNVLTKVPKNGHVSQDMSIGVAAHICAASPNGPRFASSQTVDERSSKSNGIWLCASCSVLIDRDLENYTTNKLIEIKEQAIQRFQKAIGKRIFTESEVNQYAVENITTALLNNRQNEKIEFAANTMQGSCTALSQCLKNLDSTVDIFPIINNKGKLDYNFQGEITLQSTFDLEYEQAMALENFLNYGVPTSDSFKISALNFHSPAIQKMHILMEIDDIQGSVAKLEKKPNVTYFCELFFEDLDKKFENLKLYSQVPVYYGERGACLVIKIFEKRVTLFLIYDFEQNEKSKLTMKIDLFNLDFNSHEKIDWLKLIKVLLHCTNSESVLSISSLEESSQFVTRIKPQIGTLNKVDWNILNYFVHLQCVAKYLNVEIALSRCDIASLKIDNAIICFSWAISEKISTHAEFPIGSFVAKEFNPETESLIVVLEDICEKVVEFPAVKISIPKINVIIENYDFESISNTDSIVIKPTVKTLFRFSLA